MECKKCGYDNPIVKKTCQQCSSILEGETINNVTGEIGYRNADGSFTVYKDGSMDIKGKLPSIKQRLDVEKGKVKKSIKEYYDETGMVPSISIIKSAYGIIVEIE